MGDGRWAMADGRRGLNESWPRLGWTESVWMTLGQFRQVRRRDVRERNAERMCSDRETPERIAELLDESRLVHLAPLKDSFPNESEHFRRFLGEPGTGVEQTVAVGEVRIDRSECGALVVVEVHIGRWAM